jgi:pimeloyl-ACP methyl ester carboxylesterase/DNA-binding winged helix-turn-helix (wHTH) protein
MRYKFGSFELATDTRELLSQGEPRPVEPQVFDLLHYLIEQRDRVVSQDELIAAVWNGRIVSDSAISARISAARAAIGDDGKRQQWLRTISRRGFRFQGDVEVTGAPTTPPEDRSARQRIAVCQSADGTRIAYATSGGGYPLVKAGNWLTHLEKDWNSPLWRPQLDRLGQRFRITRYDQRGNGVSDWDVPEFSLERFVEDLEAVVDAAGIERFALYGTSQGAAVALVYAARHPEQVSHLVLQGGFARGRLIRPSAAEREQAEAILTLIRHGWGKPGSAFIAAFATMFIPGGNREQIDSLVDLQRETTSPENAAALRRAVDSFDATAQLPHVRTPTLVLHSRNDAIQPLDEGRGLSAGISGAEFIVLESGNHVILPQEPAWPVLFAQIERFVLG